MIRKEFTIKTFLMFINLIMTYSLIFANPIKYPSQTQPGNAELILEGNSYNFSNNLFSASYVLNEGKLTFGGSNEMNLKSGGEIFQVTLGNGTIVKASQMAWNNIHEENLIGNADAVKLSEKDNGKALVATLTYNDLTFNWKAILRDNSHYLRTELKISTTKNTSLKNIIPLRYVVMNENGNAAPQKVGNTRGAVIASDKIFAGVETPLAINMISGENNKNFTPTSWTPESWIVTTTEVPQDILNLGFSDSKVRVSQGKVNVSSAGDWKFKFQYSSGTHRMNLVGVDVVNKDNEVVASDYHIGYTGNAASNNTYNLKINEAGDYILRYFGEVKTETITSSGNIDITKTGSVNYKTNKWSPALWKDAQTTIPEGVLNLGYSKEEIKSIEGKANISASGNINFIFKYSSGSHRMNLVGVDILNDENEVVASDYHYGFTGGSSSDNTYTLNVTEAGDYTLRYFGEIKTETITSSGNITFAGAKVTPTIKNDEITLIEDNTVEPTTEIIGIWSRNTTLKSTETFEVSTVVGMLAENQKRRSFLAYHERERAVPWRSFTLYNSWYELNINRNNDPNPANRMQENQCIPVVNSWKENLYDKYDVGINAFVWDDGWDDFNSLWDFHSGFPDGFENIDELAQEQESGIGAWLGPVGGYGSSKAQRLANWNSTHDPDISNFELSNKEYFDAFVGRCSQMVEDYDMRYFKFDGISTHFSSTGPANEEDAEGILKVVNALREKRPDIFINTTVGTWASPFWFHYSDCVWRQENDYDEIGNQGNSREKWITYRDRLVYKNFVQNSPLCPINTLMTHGLIVTKYGPPAAMSHNNSEKTFNEIVKEMRCAFACGSGMVELYLDHNLMNNIQNKKLWGELAECIKWHRANKDVLPDVHWVGGNPWDGAQANVYGWAAWNQGKSTLALRNPSSTTKAFTTTLREALDIPDYITGKIHLTDAFSNQTQYAGITNKDINIDENITFNIPPFDVVVFNGVDPSTSICKPKAKINLGVVYGENSKINFRNLKKGSYFSIFDIKGTMIKSGKAENANFSISVNNNGLYVVQIIQKNNSQSFKVICR